MVWAGCWLPLQPALVFRNFKTAELLLALETPKIRPLELMYRHSVNQGLVVERFRLASDLSLWLDSSLFQSFGAGMTDGYDEGVFSSTEVGLELSGLDRSIGRLVLALGTVADHQLAYGDWRFPLTALAPAGSSLVISGERVSLVAWLRTAASRRALTNWTVEAETARNQATAGSWSAEL